MVDNPFLSKTFTSVWLKYFNNSKPAQTFNFIRDVGFTKHRYLPVFTNVGRNITNGMFYEFQNLKEQKDYKSKVFLIHDVPEYFKVNPNLEGVKLKVGKATQFKGYLSELSEYKEFTDFLNNQFRSKRRNYLKKKKEQLETCFNIEYKFFYGNVSQQEYNLNMDIFKELIGKRFGDLGIDSNALSKWDYYHELIYKMILDKKALLFAIQRNGKPIGIAFSFISKNILFYATPTFDTDYIRFNLGHTTIIELMKWCFENNISIYDFSKGEFEYKKRWANKEYNFQTHVLYDSSSLKSIILGVYLTKYFKFKQFLRDKKINLIFSKSKYFIKNFGKKGVTSIKNYKKEYLEDPIGIDDYKLIDLDTEYSFLTPIIIEGLSINPEPFISLKVYIKKGDNKIFIVAGNKSKYSILFN